MKRFSITSLLLAVAVVAAFFAGWASKKMSANNAKLADSFHFVIHSKTAPVPAQSEVYTLRMEALVEDRVVHSWSENINLPKVLASQELELNGTSHDGIYDFSSDLELNEIPSDAVAVDVTYSTDGYSLSGRIIARVDEKKSKRFGSSYPASIRWSLTKSELAQSKE